MDDYQRRFQRSLQKLTVPRWYTDAAPSNCGSKQSINSTTSSPWKAHYRETQRTPEIVHMRHPNGYRSCRSSLATSPSPSVHSWHPHPTFDGMSLSLLRPAAPRRQKQYEKGIDRVSKSSRWYRPTPLVDKQTTSSPAGTIKTSTSIRHNQQSTTASHYDAPQIHYNDNESLIFESNCLVTNGSPTNTLVDERTNNVIASDKQRDNHLNSNESQIMPMADAQELPSRLELADQDDDKRPFFMEPPMSRTNLSPSVDQINDDVLFERAASDLVQTVLAETFLIDNLHADDNDDDDDDEKNRGVRELSDDENALRELDENDMNDTDEFIVFATKADTPDEEQALTAPRCSLNRLYTFSRTTGNNVGFHCSKPSHGEQNSTRSIHDDSDDSPAESPFDKFPQSIPMHHHPIDGQDANLHAYIDRLICPSKRQLSTHQSDDGVNEETARIGRLLLNSIPTPWIETIPERSPTPTSDRLKLSDTELILSEHDNHYDSLREDNHGNGRRDSAYSSNQERMDASQSNYEPLFECYSGYSFVQSDFISPNISSKQSTTDEAYESEPTTMSSSIATNTTTTTTHVHPDLEHEFEYPAPPPPVPDRSLKPAYLKSNAPTCPSRPPVQDSIDAAGYSVIQKVKPSPLVVIQQLITATANNAPGSSAKTMSSRHYCGSIPVAQEAVRAPSNAATPVKTDEQSKEKRKEKRTGKTLSCLHPSTTDECGSSPNKRNMIIRLPLSSSSKSKMKKQKLITDFDEATNGLAIRLPAPTVNGHDDKPNVDKSATPSSTKRANGMSKTRPLPDHIKPDRVTFYETSV